MNRRHEHLSSQDNKKNTKNIKNGIKTENKENRWADILQKQTEENKRRIDSINKNEKDL